MRKRILAVTALLTSLTACGPSPDKVCDHMTSLIEKEAGDAVKPDKAKCVKSAERKKEMKGIFGYGEWAKCIVAADSLEAADKC